MRLFNSREIAERSHEAGVTRLMFLQMTRLSRPSYNPRRLSLQGGLYFKSLGYETSKVAEDILFASIRDAAVRGLPSVRDAESFAERLKSMRGGIAARQAELVAMFERTIDEAGQCASKAETCGLMAEALDSIETQLAWLVFPGFMRSVPYENLKRYAAYFKALAIRIERAKNNPMGDWAKEARFAPYWERYREAVITKKTKPANASALAEYRWLCEEYRISVFAPEVGTPSPISPKRLDAKWDELD